MVASILLIGSMTVTVSASRADAVSGGSISGTVALQQHPGTAAPYIPSSVQIQLWDPTLPASHGAIAWTSPDSSGHYQLTELDAGLYELRFYASWVEMYQYWPGTSYQEDATLIAVAAGANVTDINMRIALTSNLHWMVVPHSADNIVCFGYEEVTSGYEWSACRTIFDYVVLPGTSKLYYVMNQVPQGDYRMWAYEYDPVTDRQTDTLWWNNTGNDRRLRSNATAINAHGDYEWAYPPEGIPLHDQLRLDQLPWLGVSQSTDVVVTSSVSPLFVGAHTVLTASFTGDSGTPSGVVEFYDDRGFIGDGALTGGSASVPYTVTHAGAWITAVYYRGNTVYDLASWTVDWKFMPTIDVLSPGYGPSSGGTMVTIDGYALSDVAGVTFGGVPGMSVTVLSDTQLTVVTPPGVDATAPVVLSTVTEASHWDASQFFAFTDVKVVAGIPAGIADVSSFKPGVVKCFQVTGKAGVPVGAVGVTLNVTASLPNAAGHVRVYPDSLNNGATPAPAVSTVNFEAGRDVANSTTIALPANGKVCAYSVGGTMSRLILDVESYMLPGSGMELTTPTKLIDTRSQSWYHVGSINGPVQPMTDYTVQVTGNAGVPVGATAVMVNITVVDTNAPGHLRMWAADQPMPNTSVVNYASETKANSQIVALSADGKLTFRSFTWVPTTVSPVQVLIDVTGYITAGSDFTATTPTTVVETRPAYTPVGLPAGALTQNKVYPLALTDTSLVPAGATAVVLNVTAVQPTNFGHIRVYPDTNGLGTTTPPIMSNINFIPGRDIPNMVIVQLPADRTIDFYDVYGGSGQTDLKVDLIGYISAPTA